MLTAMYDRVVSEQTRLCILGYISYEIVLSLYNLHDWYKVLPVILVLNDIASLVNSVSNKHKSRVLIFPILLSCY